MPKREAIKIVQEANVKTYDELYLYSQKGTKDGEIILLNLLRQGKKTRNLQL